MKGRVHGFNAVASSDGTMCDIRWVQEVGRRSVVD